MSIRHKIIFIGAILFLPITAPAYSNASTFFSDNFESPSSLGNWTIHSNGGSVQLVEGVMIISAPRGYTYPYLYPTDFLIPQDNYHISARIKLEGPLSFGFGLNLTDRLLPNGRTQDLGGNERIFLVWPSTDGTYFITAQPCPIDIEDCPFDNYRKPIHSTQLGQWMDLDIISKLNRYYVYVDKELIYTSGLSDLVISTFWVGNPQRTNQIQTWGRISIDRILFDDNFNLLNNKTKIILTPGFGASWDYHALLSGEGGSDWHIPSWITLYNNLITSLENTGYAYDQDLFIFPYDWRKNLTSLRFDLENYIGYLEASGKILPGETINLVGHSFGGLVARSYAQNNPDRINQIVSVGTPHLGAAQSYLAWEGGEFGNLNWWQKLGLGLLVQYNRRPSESPVTTVRRLAPSIKDLLPTTPFLVDELGDETPIINMFERNDYLAGLNASAGEIDPLLTAVSGFNRSTVEKYIVKPPSWLDVVLGNWTDGKPAETLFSQDGDQTVLTQSAVGGFTRNEIMSLDHSELIYTQEGIGKIFDALGLSTDSIVSEQIPLTDDKLLVAALRSPGKISIVDSQGRVLGHRDGDGIPGGIYLPTEKLVVIPGYDNGDYRVIIDGEGENGDYLLLVGNLTSSTPVWHEFSARITPEDSDSYTLEVDTSGLQFKTFDTELETVEFLEDALFLLENLVSSWPDPERARGAWLLKSMRENLNQIVLPDENLNVGALNNITNSAFNLKLLAQDLKQAAEDSITDSIMTTVEAAMVKSMEGQIILLESDFTRTSEYYQDTAEVVEDSMSLYTDDITEAQAFSKWELSKIQADSLLSVNTLEALEKLRHGARWLEYLNTRHQ